MIVPDLTVKYFEIQINYYYLVPLTESDADYDPDEPMTKWEFDNEASEHRSKAFINDYYLGFGGTELHESAVDGLLYMLRHPFDILGIDVETYPGQHGDWMMMLREEEAFPDDAKLHFYSEMPDLKYRNESAVDLDMEFGEGWTLEEKQEVWEKFTSKRAVKVSPEQFAPSDDEKRMAELERSFERFIIEFPKLSTDYNVIAVHLNVHVEYFALKEKLERV